MSQVIEDIKSEISKVVVGQEKMIEGLLAGLLCRGHILLEGVPGLAKTTTVNALAGARLISSASSKLVNTGPFLILNVLLEGS